MLMILIGTAKKNKLLRFSRNNVSTNSMLSISNGGQIDYVEQCTYLRTILYSNVTRKYIDSSANRYDVFKSSDMNYIIQILIRAN